MCGTKFDGGGCQRPEHLKEKYRAKLEQGINPKEKNNMEAVWIFSGATQQIYCIVFSGRVKDKRALELRASTLRGEMRMLKAELSQMKQFQTFQAQQFDEMIRNAKELIVQQVARMSNGNHICSYSPFVHDFQLLVF